MLLVIVTVYGLAQARLLWKLGASIKNGIAVGSNTTSKPKAGCRPVMVCNRWPADHIVIDDVMTCEIIQVVKQDVCSPGGVRGLLFDITDDPLYSIR
jgi:hypothetical protein